ncbi:MAG: ExbD/TolR family protein [Pseudomonadota bacterium]
MNLRPRAQKEEPDVNLTPLIDIVFLLLIFFMVSTSFQRDTEIALELPEADGSPLQTEPQVVEIAIDSEGRYFVNREELANRQRRTVEQAITRAVEGDEVRIIISADRRAPHEAVVRAMDAARRAGHPGISLATREPAGEGESE